MSGSGLVWGASGASTRAGALLASDLCPCNAGATYQTEAENIELLKQYMHDKEKTFTFSGSGTRCSTKCCDQIRTRSS